VSGSLSSGASTIGRAVGSAAVAATGIVLLDRTLRPTGAAAALAVDAAPTSLHARPLCLALVAGLLFAARGIWRGRRRAADLAAGLLCATIALGLARGAPIALIATEAGIAMLLVFGRRRLPAAGGRSTKMLGLTAAALLIGAYLLTAVTLLVSDRASGVQPALAGATSWLASGGSWLESASLPAVALDGVLAGALLATAVFVRALVRPAEPAEGHSCSEHRRAAAIVARYGEDSLDPFALREDKSFHFACDGMLAYRTLRETAVVSGDPIGPPGTAASILASFERFAEARGWQVVLTGASPRYIDAYRQSGLRALRIGEEAIVTPQRFSLEGRSIRKVRQSVSRLERHGWRIDIVQAGALDPAVRRELAAMEGRWRASRPRLSGFAMTLGRLWGAEEDARGLYVTARDSDGRLRAFLRFAEYARGLSLDATRRSGEEINGVTEAMVVAALAYARERGAAEVSLNFAGFAHVMTATAVSGGQRLLRLGLRLFHGRFQLERLVRFSDKFGPEWRPRYLVHRGRTSLPLAALRVLQAEAYVRPPRARPLTARWEPAGHAIPSPAPRPAAPGGALLPTATR
jgi:lysyl-tRNA synthetase class 2